MTEHYPEVIIIGVQRCGTTSLYNWLMDQPTIWNSGEPRREIGFYCFQHNWEKGLPWYAEQFNRAPAGKVVIDKTPPYFDHPLTPQRIRKAQQQMGIEPRFILLLRNPVDRAYSHYWKARAKGFEPSKTFEEALSRYSLDFEREIRRAPEILSTAYYLSVAHTRPYLPRGLYAENLKRWFAYFPRDRFLILRSEDVYTDPQSAIKACCDFIGVDYKKPRRGKRYQGLDYSPINPETRAQLELKFGPHNRDLAVMLGDDKWLWRDT